MIRTTLGAAFVAFLLAALTAGCTTTGGYTGGSGGRGGGWENFRATTPQAWKDA